MEKTSSYESTAVTLLGTVSGPAHTMRLDVRAGSLPVGQETKVVSPVRLSCVFRSVSRYGRVTVALSTLQVLPPAVVSRIVCSVCPLQLGVVALGETVGVRPS